MSWPEAQPAGGGPLPLLLTLTPARMFSFKSLSHPAEGKSQAASQPGPAFSWPTSSPAPGEWGARRRSVPRGSFLRRRRKSTAARVKQASQTRAQRWWISRRMKGEDGLVKETPTS